MVYGTQKGASVLDKIRPHHPGTKWLCCRHRLPSYLALLADYAPDNSEQVTSTPFLCVSLPVMSRVVQLKRMKFELIRSNLRHYGVSIDRNFVFDAREASTLIPIVM